MHIRNRLRRRPAISGEINRVILTLTIRMSQRAFRDPRSVLLRPPAVGIDVFYGKRLVNRSGRGIVRRA